MSNEQPKEDQLALRENQELENWQKEGKPPLPITLALKMYELYLNGYSCDEIYRIQGGKFPLGQIVDAKIRHNWEATKQTQLAMMYANVQERVLKTKNDATINVMDMLAASHSLISEKIREYLLTKDEEVIKELGLSNIKNYKMLVSMFQELAAPADKKQDKNIKVEGKVEHVHRNVADAKLTPAKSFDILSQIAEVVEEPDNG